MSMHPFLLHTPQRSLRYISPPSHSHPLLFRVNRPITFHVSGQYNSITSDFVERQMANIDDRVAKFYVKLDAVNNDYELADNEWQMLQYFINAMFWRLPCNEPILKNFIARAQKLGDFGIKLMNTTTNELAGVTDQMAFLERVKSDPHFPKFLKLNMPAFTYHHRVNYAEKDLVHIINFPFQLPKLISDNPIIFKNTEGVPQHLDDMIFPLTPTKTLFRNKLPRMITHSYIRVMIDMMMLLQSNEYIATTDKNYPLQLLKAYASEYKSIETLRKFIFSNVGEKKDELSAYLKYGSDIEA